MKDREEDEAKKKFEPRVSIVIPVYNGSDYLKSAIDSALGQSYRNIEVIVVNDGSNDSGKTRDIALSYGNAIRYFEKENGGVATALNLGIQEMSGEYFSWLSHDDLYYPQKIAAQIERLSNQDNKEAILFSNFTIKNCVTNTIADAGLIEEQALTIPSLLHLLFASRIHGCSMLFPKSCFENIGLFSEQLKTTQDYDFYFRLLKEGYEFRYIPDSLILTRHHKGQGTLTLFDLHVKEVNRLYIWAFELFFEYFQAFPLEQLDKILNLMESRGLKDAYSHIGGFREFRINKIHLDANQPVIWLYWENKQGQETPELIKLCWETVKRRNEGVFRVIVTNPNSIAYYLPHLNPAVRSFDQIAHRADYIRFNLLYQFGGIWLDSDFVAFRSLSPVLKKIEQHGFVYTGYREMDGRIFPVIHFLGSKRSNPILEYLIKNADDVLDRTVALGIQPEWDDIGGRALQKVLTEENSFCYETHFFAPLAMHTEGQKEIFYPVRLSRRLQKISFGQMLPYSVCSQFLNLMGRQILNMKCYLSDILINNVSHRTLYEHRFSGLIHILANQKRFLSPKVYARLRDISILLARMSWMTATDPKQFLKRIRQRFGRRFGQ